MAKKRAKNLTDKSLEVVAQLLDGWRGKLTWSLLVDAVESRLHSRYTRQALFQHARVRTAFELAKKRVALSAGRRARTAEMQVALDHIDRIEARNDRLEAENQQLLEQFARWAYNAHLRGLDDKYLNQPLPQVNRRRSVGATHRERDRAV